MRGLIGKKIGMTRVFDEDGRIVPVTVIEAGPCLVTQVKTVKRDGYEAVQAGFGDRKLKHTTKPLQGHFEAANISAQKVLVEFDKVPGFDYKSGQSFHVGLFNEGEFVDGYYEGEGVFYAHPNSPALSNQDSYFTGTFKNGVYHGLIKNMRDGVKTKPPWKQTEIYYKNGKQHGSYKQYDEQGKVIVDQTYEDGFLM